MSWREREREREREKKMPFIVATYVYASSQGQRTHSARTKNALYSGHLRLCQQPRAAHALRSDQQIAAYHFTPQSTHQKKAYSYYKWWLPKEL
jgi:hypothetical protein